MPTCFQADVERRTRRVAGLGSRTMVQPFEKQTLNLGVVGLRMTTAQVLAHQGDAGLIQVEGRAE